MAPALFTYSITVFEGTMKENPETSWLFTVSPRKVSRPITSLASFKTGPPELPCVAGVLVCRIGAPLAACFRAEILPSLMVASSADLLAQEAGVESIGRARVTDNGHVVLKLDLVGVCEFKNRSIPDFDLDDRDVFTLIGAFTSWRAVLFDLERQGGTVGNDHVVNLLEILQLAVLIYWLMSDRLKVLGSLLSACAICCTICQNKACLAFCSPSFVVETTCALVAM